MEQFIEIKSDVLILGGGVAGLMAAITAREAGAQVLVVDKGAIARSGCIGAGVDHFSTFLEEGEPWDTADAWLEQMTKTSKGAVDLKVHETIFCRVIKPALARMAKLGNDLRDPKTGRYHRGSGVGTSGSYLINFNGKDFKPNLAKEARRLGVNVLEKVMASRLLVSQGRWAGTLAFHIRTGQPYFLRAKAAVAATGNANRLFEHPTGLVFNAWHSPFNTGDAAALAFRAGAALANMEYMYMNVVPKGFSAPGFAAFFSMGCYLINAAGERFMFKYNPGGERAPRYKVVEGVMAEVEGGRGPIYIDCRHLEERDIAHLKATLDWDKNTFSDYLSQKGVDLKKEPLEVMVSEGCQTMEGVSGGVKIDERCAASLPGLYAGGDCTDQASALNKSTTSGYVAGREAAKYAAEAKELASVDQDQIKAEKARLETIRSRKRGIAAKEFEEILYKIMTESVGIRRSEAGLKVALTKLGKMRELEKELMARDYHELMRCQEALNLYTVGEAMARAALFRQESRFGLCHHRLDYPRTDDENWCGLVVIKKTEGDPQISFQPLQY